MWNDGKVGSLNVGTMGGGKFECGNDGRVGSLNVGTMGGWEV